MVVESPGGGGDVGGGGGRGRKTGNWMKWSGKRARGERVLLAHCGTVAAVALTYEVFATFTLVAVVVMDVGDSGRCEL